MSKDPNRTARLAAFIANRLKELGISAAEASRRSGLGSEAIRDIIRGSTPSADKIVRLAKGLEVDRDELFQRAGTPEPGIRQSLPVPEKPVDGNLSRRLDQGSLDLPLSRQEHPIREGVSRDVYVSMIERPAPLTGRDRAYAVYVPDGLNAPIIREGDVAYVDASRPATVGTRVRIFPIGAPAFIAILESHDAERIGVRVASEPTVRYYPAAEIARMERVVGFLMLDV